MTGCYRPEFTIKGVDYLITGDKVSDAGNITVWTMKEWLGREEMDKIEGYLKEGKALNHFNHLCWTPNKWMAALKAMKPEWYEPLTNIINGADVATEYAKMPKGPIEEITKTLLKEGYIIELPFKCVDFGTWESLDKFYSENKNGSTDEKIMAIESSGNLVRKPADKVLALIGIKDTVVIDTGDALLICPKKLSGNVKEITTMLKDKNLTDYL